MEEHESQTKVTAFLEINEDAEDFEMEIGDTGLQGQREEFQSSTYSNTPC